MRHLEDEARNALSFLSGGKPEGVGFAITDTARRILYANDELCRISRQPRADLVGVDLDVVLAGRQWVDIIEAPIHGSGGERLGSMAFVRLVH